MTDGVNAKISRGREPRMLNAFVFTATNDRNGFLALLCE